MKVPCTVITGSLGVGKTTSILHLVGNRPDPGRWAVLVNEAGEVGVDGPILGESGLFVKEIAGGCVCCSAGLELQVALVRLLREVRPDRLVIEPTGLAHPAAVLDALRRPGVREATQVQATITLVDPRHLADPRRTGSATWQDQIAVADVLVANKVDVCTEAQVQAFWEFAQATGGWTRPGST
jgi:G3E family GTPase